MLFRGVLLNLLKLPLVLIGDVRCCLDTYVHMSKLSGSRSEEGVLLVNVSPNP